MEGQKGQDSQFYGIFPGIFHDSSIYLSLPEIKWQAGKCSLLVGFIPTDWNSVTKKEGEGL